MFVLSNLCFDALFLSYLGDVPLKYGSGCPLTWPKEVDKNIGEKIFTECLQNVYRRYVSKCLQNGHSPPGRGGAAAEFAGRRESRGRSRPNQS